MSAQTTEAKKKTNDSDPQARSTEGRTRVSTRGVQTPEVTTNENIPVMPPRGTRIVDAADDEQEAVEKARRERRALRQDEAFLEPVFERGMASDRYVEALHKGYDGVTSEDIPDEAFTVAGVTKDPSVAAKSGKRYLDVEDVNDRARRELGRQGEHDHNPSAVAARERREKRDKK